MFYYYFRVFNWFCCLCGIKKPFILPSGQHSRIKYWNKLWSITVIAGLIALDYISINVTSKFTIKRNLQQIGDTNDLTFNIITILLNLNGEKICLELYETVNNIFSKFRLSDYNLKMISLKLYAWFFLPTATLFYSILMELFAAESPQFSLLIRVPCYLSTLHLVVHLHLILAVLRLVNNKLSRLSALHVNWNIDLVKVGHSSRKLSTLKYFLDLNINFIETDEAGQNCNLTFLCKVYDDLSSCIQLLEAHHGKQILFSIWMMFSSAVIGATLISCEETKNTMLVITRCVLPFTWFALCCFVDDKLKKEVEWTEILIMKQLIDFRCDLHRKNILETFKQLVNTNKLQFTAANLFHVNYAMILGISMNVVTYSIILVQLFINTN